jgi:hypothetical protein
MPFWSIQKVKKQPIPYAVANHVEIMGGHYHFVDKIRSIQELENNQTPDMLRHVLSQIRASGAPPVLIIVDEYDNFTNQLLTTRQDRLYKDVIGCADATSGDSFLRTFFKVIKAGIGEGTVARCFITGVLPVTIDDLTSGFNIAQIVTLKEHTWSASFSRPSSR